MPAYSEIHLGFVGRSAVSNAIAALGIVCNDGTQPTAQDLINGFNFDNTDVDKLNPQIEAAYMATASRLGWVHLATDSQFRDFDTPHGKRRTSIFGLSFNYDTDEIGDEPDDCSLGINLSARYFPTVLDISDPHGGLAPSNDLARLLSHAEICKQEIVKRLPAFEAAHIHLREVFA